MKESTRQKKHDEKVALLLGITVEEVLQMRAKEEADDKVREVQAVHLFLEKPEAFISKFCKECHQQFLTTYQFVSYCSSHCRIKSLEKCGIVWNPLHTPQNRWSRTKIPTDYSIPPKALELLLTIAKDQQEREMVDCETDEPVVETQHTPQSKIELDTDQDFWPAELDEFLDQDFSY